jgi:hypothetical protein
MVIGRAAAFGKNMKHVSLLCSKDGIKSKSKKKRYDF